MDMNSTPRFTGPSDAIDLARLEREDRPFWYSGIIIGIIALALIMLMPLRYTVRTLALYEDRTMIAVPIELVIRPPRPRSPFIMRRIDDTRRVERVRRAFRQRTPDTSGVPASPRTDPIAEQMARPDNYPEEFGESFVYVIPEDLPPEIKALIDPPEFEIERIYQDLAIEREPSPSSPERIELRNELVALEDFDYGRFMAAFAMDPDDPKAFRGFTHIPSAVYGVTLEPPEGMRRAVQGLAEALEKYSDVSAIVDKPIHIDQLNGELKAFEYPMLHLMADGAFDLTSLEQESLAAWLRSGGSLFVEATGGRRHPSDPPDGAMSIRQMLRDVLGSAGELRTISNDHFLYSCFYDFPEGPPRPPYQPRETTRAQSHEYLEGIWLDGRLAVLYSEKKYSESLHFSNPTDAVQKFAVNIVVCLLSQGSGKVLKIIDGVAFTR
jgi:hypothetical protein